MPHLYTGQATTKAPHVPSLCSTGWPCKSLLFGGEGKCLEVLAWLHQEKVHTSWTAKVRRGRRSLVEKSGGHHAGQGFEAPPRQ